MRFFGKSSRFDTHISVTLEWSLNCAACMVNRGKHRRSARGALLSENCTSHDGSIFFLVTQESNQSTRLDIFVNIPTVVVPDSVNSSDEEHISDHQLYISSLCFLNFSHCLLVAFRQQHDDSIVLLFRTSMALDNGIRPFVAPTRDSTILSTCQRTVCLGASKRCL